MWKKTQIGLGVLALGLAFIGQQFSMPLLLYTGIACLGMMSMVMGWEAILTGHIVAGRHGSGDRGTYTGVPAIFRGVQLNFLGLFLILAAVLTYMNANAREAVLHMVRRPGLPLIFLGGLALMQAVITIVGSLESRQGSRSAVLLNLFFSRLLPGIFLAVIGAGAMGLGLFEILAPDVFDAKGGGFLEVLYGVR